MTSVNRADNNLSRFQYKHLTREWWVNFNRGMAGGRYLAAKEERDAGHQSEADRQENKAKEYSL